MRLVGTKRIAPFRGAAPVPTSNPALLGVLASAGVFYQAYDLGKLLGDSAGAPEGHVIFLRDRSPGIAIRVDRVLGVANLVELGSDASTRMRAVHPAVTAFVRPLDRDAFDGRTISLLDTDQLASESREDRLEGDQRVDQ
jgi:chemotaxis signal transduction protein